MSNDEHSSDLPETISLCDQSDGKTYALLIGVDQYLHIESLDYCGEDVELFYTCLLRNVGMVEDDNNIKRLKSSERRFIDLPLHHVIDYWLDYYINRATENDKLIVLFSGHGFEVKGDSYLAPADLCITPKDEYKTDTAISLRELVTRLDHCPAKFKWLIVDACRKRQEIAKPNDSYTLKINKFLKYRGSIIFQSCQSGKSSFASSRQRNSIFVRTLVDALRGDAPHNEDGVITMKGVVEYVTLKTSSAACELGFVQRPCVTTKFNDLNRIVLTDKIEGMNAFQLTKGKRLISKARQLFYEFQDTTPQEKRIFQKLQEASNMVQDALDLHPDPAGNFYREWTRLKADINREVQNQINKQQEQLENKRTINRLTMTVLEQYKKISEMGKRQESQNIPQTKEEGTSVDEFKVLQIREPENDTKRHDDLRNRPNVSDSSSLLNDNSDAASPNDKSDGEPPLNDNFEQGNSDKYI